MITFLLSSLKTIQSEPAINHLVSLLRDQILSPLQSRRPTIYQNCHDLQ